MDNLSLIQPSLAYEAELMTYREAFDEEHIYGGANLAQYEKIADWLSYLEKMSDESTCPPDRAPSTTFLCVRQSDNAIVGMCNIRHHIKTAFLLNIGGHIGYSIKPSERLKGYATRQLHLALLEAQKMGLEKVLLTCAEDNIGSEKTILANGGIYEDTRYDASDDENIKRYWIDLEKLVEFNW
ncbi:GNAT family N-acetyltransferase [Streptococcus zalophi]|uniref:GNAT family N-acetyltransferase n=1 Tax=Streptococcus zalophi TaxID=640031 RepID=A0A934UDT6_9STRE|nr:GNAT family N-acetyltransferase [Streptococcus zalophi]MBJ8350028.1 GNAT family N-acetyltransferase [Streptococcus zalophi]